MRINRRVLACFCLIAVLGGYVALSGGKSLTDASCDLGPPPDSPGFAEARAREAAELKREGYIRVCEANLARYDIASSLQSMDRAMAGLAFTPVALAGTPFAKLGSVGGMAETVSDVKSRLYRRFRFPDGRMATLFEHDMSADGSQMYRDPREEPDRINGLPARLLVMQASSGKAVSVLSWKEGRRFYEIWIDANVTLSKLRPQLFALAASLPASVAARANEPESLPPAFGPEGRPLHSIPATILVPQVPP